MLRKVPRDIFVICERGRFQGRDELDDRRDDPRNLTIALISLQKLLGNCVTASSACFSSR